MKKMMLALLFLVTTGVFTAEAQVRVVVRTPRAGVIIRRPVRPVVVRPVVVVARRAVVARPAVVVRPVRVVRPRVVVYR